VSKAQLLREGARRILGEELSPEEDSILGIVGLGHGDPGVASEEHDHYLAEQRLAQGRC